MGGESKVTVMVLKVDLDCSKCCRKIKKVLCSTPQIRDQLFDEKSNTVTISVICCSPENVADKISRKAGGTIKSIDIKSSQTTSKPPGDKLKDGPGPGQHPPVQQKQGPPPAKPNSAQPTADKPKPAPPKNEGGAGGGRGDGGKPNVPPQKMADGGGGGGGGGGNADKPKKVDFAPMGGPPPQQQFPMGPPKPNQPGAFMSPESIPVAGYPSIFPPVVHHDGGPYYQNQGMAAMASPQRFPHTYQPVYQYDGYTGRPVGNGYRSDYFSDESPSTCSVM